MENNFEQRLDELAREIEEMKRMMAMIRPALRGELQTHDPSRRVQRMEHMHPDEDLAARMVELCDKAEEHDVSGMIAYMGVFASGGRQSNWIRKDVDTDRLLHLVESGMAEKVLACIGNPDRLNILMAILKKPMSVSEIVSECGLNSTGQAYHHMKPLLAADLIAEDSVSAEQGKKGVYIVCPDRVQGIIMLLAGISDMLDENYTLNGWEEE